MPHSTNKASPSCTRGRRVPTPPGRAASTRWARRATRESPVPARERAARIIAGGDFGGPDQLVLGWGPAWMSDRWWILSGPAGSRGFTFRADQLRRQ
ncbi:hypothetical protein [Streptomyces globisporus]|uniref:hypothetical protein n=1 Tax=Streptomyces globisporus TaxID=1908 RepID=UPI0011B0067C|nr:hypothetical protein [Streptomyces globisporus]WSF79072.1 hypothetical protein OG838_24465 [Streptomyces globisporus]